MRKQSPKYNFVFISGIIIILLSVGVWLWFYTSEDIDTDVVMVPPEIEVEPEPIPDPFPVVRSLGESVEGRNIEVYSFGDTEKRVLLVGGIHGGYEWNSIVLAYEMIDYLTVNPDFIPEGMSVDIIPNLNPDGLYVATGLEGRFVSTDIKDNSMHQTGTGRFNANDVDLNRNFDCNWEPSSSWRGQVVSAGEAPFSEPEAILLRDLVSENKPLAAAFWHSQANNVYASECNDGPLPLTLEIMQAYADAGNYGAVPVFDAYPITGDVEGWMASVGIAAITVELETRTDSGWDRNLAGTRAMLEAVDRYLAEIGD